MKVCIVVLAYNHAKYIAHTIESILSQKVSFDFEIVIGEDCSTDDTRLIIVDFKKKFPDKFRLLLHETNLGPRENFLQTFNACRGDYIAYVDGDDYWTCDEKLQRQVDFLDNHRHCAICFHANTLLEETGAETVNYPPERKPVYTLRDLLQKNFVPTESILVRSGIFQGFPQAIYSDDNIPGDWYLLLSIGKHGDIGYIDQIMSTHRRHDAGVWTSLRYWRRFQARIKLYHIVDKELNYQYRKTINRSIVKMRIAMYFTMFFPFLIAPLLAVRNKYFAN